MHKPAFVLEKEKLEILFDLDIWIYFKIFAKSPNLDLTIKIINHQGILSFQRKTE